MPIEAQIFLWVVGLVLAITLLVLGLRKRSRTADHGHEYVSDTRQRVVDAQTRRRLDDAVNARYGVTSADPEELEKPFRVAEENVRKHPPVSAPHPKPLNQVPHGVRLSRIDLGHINVQRRANNRPPLNVKGFRRAIAAAPHQTTSADWFTYLILYDCLLDADQQSHPEVDVNLHADPNLPYNGQGGEFAGGGATGDWTGGAGLLDDSGGPATAPSDYGAADATKTTEDTYTPYTPEPTPSTDPSPSYTPDPSPSMPDTSSSFSSGGGDGN